MNRLLLQIISYTFLAVLLYNIVIFPKVEAFVSSPNVILIGNIFSDRDHTKYLSIKERLIKNKSLHTGQLITIDDNCSTLDDFKKSLDTLKRRHPELDSDNTYIFVSVGFHDLIKNVHNCEEAVEVQPRGSENAGLARKLPCIAEGEIFNKWKIQLDELRKQFSKTTITIMSAYYLPKNKELNECGIKIMPTKHIADDIDAWNADLAHYCVTNNLGFIAMDKEFNVEDIISGSTDLNNNAKKKLVSIIGRKIH